MVSISELGILADDLTGACDAAAAFAPRAGAVRVHVGVPGPGAGRPGTGLAVINMQSRLLGPARSRRRAARAARLIRGARVVYVKTDSVLRGPVGAELEGISSVFPGRRVYLVPAVPEMGKTTVGGRLFERGVPAHLTDYARDPASPLLTNDARQIIQSTGRVQLEIVDAETSGDIERAVSHALSDGSAILAGSVGLADALARCMEGTERACGVEDRAGRLMIVCGSGYPSAREQLQRAASAFGSGIVTLGKEAGMKEMLRMCGSSRAAFLQIETGPLGAWGELSALFRKVGRVITAFRPGSLGIVGGETAFRILRRLGTTQLTVVGRELPGVACGIIRDGALAGSAFATKGGSVGDPDACVRMVEWLQRSGGSRR
ncbi:MAG TPA: four-carbon acid sugar kinase family protein [Spirochaetia bacterium]|nr:four-carbon acid sugar kinase family protein [Spirochaetia bacterium]